jgi:hypothetical protein
MSYIQTFDSEVIVRKPEHLSGTLDSTKVYVIDGEVDMGSQAITVPPDGLEIRGLGLNKSILKSTAAAYTMFVDSAADSGGLSLADMTLTCSGATSKIFELDNAGATSPSTGRVELIDVNYTDVTEIGDLSNFSQLLQMTCVWNGVDDGYTFHGTWSGAAFVDSFLVRNFGSSGVMFREGSGDGALTFGSRMFCNGNIDVPFGSTVYDFTDSVFGDAKFELIFGNYSGAGTVTSNIMADDTEARFRDNNGIQNTYVGARWEMTTELATTVSASATDYKAAGATTYSDEFWFSNTTDNAFVFDSTISVDVEIKGAISLAGVNGQTIQLKVRKWDDSESTYVDIQTVPGREMASTGAAASVAILAYATIDSPSDRIELWGQNIAHTGDFTVKDNSIFTITERAN